MAIRELGLQVRTDIAPQLRLEFDASTKVTLRSDSTGRMEFGPDAGITALKGTATKAEFRIEPGAVNIDAEIVGDVRGTGNFVLSALNNAVKMLSGGTLSGQFKAGKFYPGQALATYLNEGLSGNFIGLRASGGVFGLQVIPETDDTQPSLELYTHTGAATHSLKIQRSGDAWVFNPTNNAAASGTGLTRVRWVGNLPVEFDNPVRQSDGNAGTPSLSFTSRKDTGFFLVPGATPADAEVHLSLNGVDQGAIGALTFPILAADGTLAAPSYSFASDPDTGISLVGGKLELGFGGASIIGLNGGGIHLAKTAYAPDALGTTAASPLVGYSFEGAATTGLDYSSLFKGIRIKLEGKEKLSFSGTTTKFLDTTNIDISNDGTGIFGPVFSLSKGSNLVYAIYPIGPSVDFSGGTGSTALTFAVKFGGTKQLRIEETVIKSQVAHEFIAGTEAAPGIRFVGGTGIYYVSAAPQTLGFTFGGKLHLGIQSDKINAYQPLRLIDSATPVLKFLAGTVLAEKADIEYKNATKVLEFLLKLTGEKFVFSVATTSALLTIGEGEVVSKVPIIGPDGVVTGPGLAFNSRKNTGLYLVPGPTPADAKIHYAINGVDQGPLLAGASTLPDPLLIEPGTAAAPALAFKTDTKTGMYHAGTNVLGFGVKGAKALEIGPTEIKPFHPVHGLNGSLTGPTYSFASDPDTGVLRAGANILGLVAGGGTRLTIENAKVRAYVPLHIPDGVATAPGLAFASQPNCGMYQSAYGAISFAPDGAEAFRISLSALFGNLISVVSGQFRVPAGDAAHPSFGFSANTGLFQTANAVHYSKAGVDQGELVGTVSFAAKWKAEAAKAQSVATSGVWTFNSAAHFKKGSPSAPNVQIGSNAGTGLSDGGFVPDVLILNVNSKALVQLSGGTNPKVEFAQGARIQVDAHGTAAQPALTLGGPNNGLFVTGTGASAKIHVSINGLDKGTIPGSGPFTAVAKGSYSIRGQNVPPETYQKVNTTPVTVTGARFNDFVYVNLNQAINDDRYSVMYWGFVVAADTVDIYVYNPSPTASKSINFVTANILIFR